ncbi:MAG: hypothetical protein M1824_006607 [Vezdaea acicularis]|nr:MAG: hypothetical protein M1824_006607 [Vezdaea acicularis]
MPHVRTPAKQNLSKESDKSILPPSPPESVGKVSNQVTEIIEYLQARKNGSIPLAWDKPWNAINLSVEEYDDFETLLKKDKYLKAYVDNKVRYDWDSRRHKLIFRMPTTIHEVLLNQVSFNIQVQLDAIRRRTGLAGAAIAKQLYFTGSSDVLLQDTQKDKRSPDIQWCHDRGPPPLIIEVSYGQSKKNLSQLADDYIVGSLGNIGTVVGIDIEYRGTREARVMKWQRDIVVADDVTYLKSKQVSNEIFRYVNGDTSPGNFVLRLEDFASLGLQDVSQEDKATTITISHETLSEYLNEAEKLHRNMMEDSKNHTYLSTKNLPPNIKMCPRPKTPPEEIEAADEAEFVEAASATERRRSEEDDDFDGVGVGNNSGIVRRSSRNV